MMMDDDDDENIIPYFSIFFSDDYLPDFFERLGLCSSIRTIAYLLQ